MIFSKAAKSIGPDCAQAFADRHPNLWELTVSVLAARFFAPAVMAPSPLPPAMESAFHLERRVE